MKVAIIGTTAQSILGFRLDLIKALVSKTYEVHTFAIDFTEESKRKVIEIGAIPNDYDLNRSGLNPLNDIYCTIKLRRILKKIQPDVVLSYFSKPTIFGTLAAAYSSVEHKYAMLEGLGYLFTEQPKGQTLKNKFLKKIQVELYRIAFKKLSGLILLNNDDKKDLLDKYNISINKLFILGGIGLNLNDYNKSSPPIEPVSFIFIGRLLSEKGIYEYISAAKKIKSKYPFVQFNVIGDIDAENPGSLSLNELNILLNDGVINYQGYVSNVSEWISRSSVFVLPSYREGFPRSTQEAMAIGRAVITTDVPGCRDTVQQGVNGYIVERWSDQALVDSFEKFILNSELIQEMGENSYIIARDNYDSNHVNEKLMNFIGV